MKKDRPDPPIMSSTEMIEMLKNFKPSARYVALQQKMRELRLAGQPVKPVISELEDMFMGTWKLAHCKRLDLVHRIGILVNQMKDPTHFWDHVRVYADTEMVSNTVIVVQPYGEGQEASPTARYLEDLNCHVHDASEWAFYNPSSAALFMVNVGRDSRQFITQAMAKLRRKGLA